MEKNTNLQHIMQFSHLHVHTQYSLLDGAASIAKLVAKAKADNMKAIAITDHGNMFGAFKFHIEATKANLKPIIGCEFYLVEDRFQKNFTLGAKDKRYHQLLLAKNQIGYKNLSKLCSLGYLEGMYSKYPRIDLELLNKYKEGLICTTCCIGAQIPQAILYKSEEEAEKLFVKWHIMFGEDFYVELQRHNLKNINGTGKTQEDINQVLIKFATKYNVKIIATNDSHYVEKEDANAHDILLCINTGEFQNTPKATNEENGKGFRFGFPNDEFFFKTTEEMALLFKDLPEAIENTIALVDSITTPEIKRDIMIPSYPLPKEFNKQSEFLRHLCYEGAKKRYGGVIPEPIHQRLESELAVLIEKAFEGYFLIVQDFMQAARDMDVWVGPGRGSAAGSLVAYVLGITNVDPVKYDLLFERFLNPQRNSMPDIDIDFEDRTRDKVLEYVANKYGKNQIAQIVTYGTMAVKSAIKDVSRVMQLPLSEANRLTKLVPAMPVKFNDLLHTPLADLKKNTNINISVDEFENIKKLREDYQSVGLISDVLKGAEKLEGSVRNTGVHACGLIIASTDITDLVPASLSKESPYMQVQYDVKLIEDAGLLKMDFLGLSTLSILKDAVNLIFKTQKIKIDLDTIPLDDPKTYELFKRGETNGVFQFESDGMKSHMRNLKPNRFDDLIAMNALYRPGPIQYIPNFIRRKNGLEKVEYDLPECKELLESTYGITVYQEQVMLLSQKLADFSQAEADDLRKAMGKKDKPTIEKLETKFITNALKKGYPESTLIKIYADWKEFASYAFNKSHSTCYALIAYQSAYLKANYTAEFMAALLQNVMGDIKNITKYMTESKRLGINVLGPDLNESDETFAVTPNGSIRFGLAAIKGVGGLENLMIERNLNGPFTSIFDLASRVKTTSVNKKNLEAMVAAGAFDFDTNFTREQMLLPQPNSTTNGIEIAIKYGARVQANKLSGQFSIFGGDEDGFTEPQPKLNAVENLSLLDKLKKEYDVVGLYLSEHPLDTYKLEYELLKTHSLNELQDALSEDKKLNFTVVGMIADAKEIMGKGNKHFGLITLADYSGSFEFRVFGDEYFNNKQWFNNNYFVVVKGNHAPSKYDPQKFFTNVNQVLYLPHIQEKGVVKSVNMLLTQTDLLEPNTNSIETSNIEILTENNVMENMAILNPKVVGEELFKSLEELFLNYPGKTPLYIEFLDTTEDLKVSLVKEQGINFTAELRQKLIDLGLNIQATLNIKL